MAEENISIFLVLFVTLLALVLILSKYLHEAKKLSSIVPEAAMVIAIGMAAGYIIHIILGEYLIQQQANLNNGNAGNDDDEQTVEDDLAALLSFDPEFFFIFLLPPIIFNTGLRMGPLFFRHITPIIMFAIVGTAISAIATALILHLFVRLGLSGGFEPTLPELLTFGALISSTDPVSTLAVFQIKRVDPRLFYLCFGESVLNDALAIVLFYSFGKFISVNEENDVGRALRKFLIDLFTNFVGSSVLGAFGGASAAFLFKQIDMRHNRLVEISVYVLLVYIPFLIAEILHLSGIVTILFTGVAANRYIVPNLSAITKVNSDMVFRLGAHLAETAIFLELGLSVFGMVGYWNWVFIGWALLACLIARALNVYPLAFIFNRILLVKDKIPSPTTGWGDVHSTKYPTMNSRPTELCTPTVKNASHANTMMWGDIERNDPETRNYGNHSVTDTMDDRYNSEIAYRTQSFSDQSVATEVTATPWESKDLKIRRNTTHMLWFCGLRGAVAYACVRTFPDDLGHRKDFAVTTMAIILITVFVLGVTTECALSWFDIDVDVDEKKYMKAYLREPIASNALINLERRLVKRCVIRDFDIMESIRTDVQRNYENQTSPTMVIRDRRPTNHGPEGIEMTESGYLGALEDDDMTIQKLVRTDSLFDYGGY